jgi:hypothetical protein
MIESKYVAIMYFSTRPAAGKCSIRSSQGSIMVTKAKLTWNMASKLNRFYTQP